MLARNDLIEKIEAFLARTISSEELGWWAFDLLVDATDFEPGYDRLIRDALQALQYFHDDEPMMQSFYPETGDLIYYIKCLKGEELYNPKRVPHWKV